MNVASIRANCALDWIIQWYLGREELFETICFTDMVEGVPGSVLRLHVIAGARTGQARRLDRGVDATMEQQSQFARFFESLSNLTAGRLTSPEYERQPLASWEIPGNSAWLLTDVRIVDVDNGKLRPQTDLLVKGDRIEALILPGEIDGLRQRYEIVAEIDGGGRHLIPGLSDIHCHLTLINEYEMGLGSLRHFPSQRLRNAESTLEAGCTFIRDSGSAVETIQYLAHEIEGGRLLGPRIFASNGAVTPKGGMWYINPIVNKLYEGVAGGTALHYPGDDDALADRLEFLQRSGCDFLKTYFEHRPFCGKDESAEYTLFTPEQARQIRRFADQQGKLVEAHTMFIEGSRRAIDAHLDSLAHLTLDEPYSVEDAAHMADNGVAIVPTLSLGMYLSMDCGPHGFPDHPDVRYFIRERQRTLPDLIERRTVEPLRHSYQALASFLDERLPERKMVPLGPVIAGRVHGMARHAQESLMRFQDAGVQVGVGTDAGTGVSFCGSLGTELRTLIRFGYTEAQVLRMATLGNMEILRLADELGSIEPGKYADMVLLGDNPLEDINAIETVRQVFKGGRLVYTADDC